MKCVCGHYRFEHLNLTGKCLVKGCNCEVYRLIEVFVGQNCVVLLFPMKQFTNSPPDE